MIASAQVTVGTSAVQLIGANGGRRTLLVSNRHATNNLFIGPSGVTTGNGFQVGPGQVVEVRATQDALFGIASAVSTPAHVLEVSA